MTVSMPAIASSVHQVVGTDRREGPGEAVEIEDIALDQAEILMVAEGPVPKGIPLQVVEQHDLIVRDQVPGKARADKAGPAR